MKALLNILFILPLLLYPLSLAGQEEKETPSQKTKEAVEKLKKAPEQVTKGLGGLNLGLGAPVEKRPTKSGDRLSIPDPSTLKTSEDPRYSPQGKRDPFRPFTLKTQRGPVSENASPLERYDLAQYKLVAIIWDIEEPRAMVEDTTSLGFIIKIGTPIGTNGGKVKAITPSEVVVEEDHVDFYGVKKARQVSMQLAPE